MDVYTEHEARDYAGYFHDKYPLKKDKQTRAKAILNDAPLNTPLPEREFNALLALLAGHPDVSQKIGPGVVSIDVRPAAHGTRCFYLTRVDGSSTDFSYLKCLGKPTARQDCHAALRNAIKRDMAVIKTYKLALPDPRCEVTGLPIDKSNSHVHHAPPMFDVLADGWLETNGGVEAVAARLENGDNVYGNELAEDDARSWLTWHSERAVLQLVHRSANAHIEAARRAIRKAG